MGGTTTETGEKTIIKGLTLEEVRKQSEITAKDAIRQLQESIDHGFMTYPELIGILKFHLKKSMDEMRIFKPDNLTLSLKNVDLHGIYKSLDKLEKREEKSEKESVLIGLVGDKDDISI